MSQALGLMGAPHMEMGRCPWLILHPQGPDSGEEENRTGRKFGWNWSGRKSSGDHRMLEVSSSREGRSREEASR